MICAYTESRGSIMDGRDMDGIELIESVAMEGDVIPAAPKRTRSRSNSKVVIAGGTESVALLSSDDSDDLDREKKKTKKVGRTKGNDGWYPTKSGKKDRKDSATDSEAAGQSSAYNADAQQYVFKQPKTPEKLKVEEVMQVDWIESKR